MGRFYPNKHYAFVLTLSQLTVLMLVTIILPFLERYLVGYSQTCQLPPCENWGVLRSLLPSIVFNWWYLRSFKVKTWGLKEKQGELTRLFYRIAPVLYKIIMIINKKGPRQVIIQRSPLLRPVARPDRKQI